MTAKREFSVPAHGASAESNHKIGRRAPIFQWKYEQRVILTSHVALPGQIEMISCQFPYIKRLWKPCSASIMFVVAMKSSLYDRESLLVHQAFLMIHLMLLEFSWAWQWESPWTTFGTCLLGISASCLALAFLRVRGSRVNAPSTNMLVIFPYLV